MPVAKSLETIEIGTHRDWRAWLRKHHATSPGVWVVFYKSHTGRPSIADEDFVREALCFGWIDSLIKRLDDDRYARKVTPRTRTSPWSSLNRRRWAELKAQGLLSPAGLSVAPTSRTYAPKPKIPVLPPYIAKAFKANPKVWTFFQTLTPTYRRHFVVWIHMAKRPETRDKRIRESVRLLAAGEKLGLK